MKTKTLLISLMATALVSCGGEASAGKGNPQGNGSGAGNGSEPAVTPDTTAETTESTETSEVEAESSGGANIKYLRENHDHYSHYSDTSSYPVELHINGDQVYWDIQANTEQDATILAGHIEFMGNALEEGNIPRAWDKLFVLEAFLHEQIHTEVEQEDTRVTIYKTGDNACAYELVKVHASAVSNEFFATGDISADHSSTADDILAMDICADQRDEAEAFIAEHWEPK